MLTLTQIKTHPFTQKIHRFLHSYEFPLAIIIFGIIARLSPYLQNRSLWVDEAVLALNILKSSYLELLQPLDYEQVAPIGFLWLEKLATQLFGDSEYAFRLIPLLSSIASLFLFQKLARICLSTKFAVNTALILFATSQVLIYYAAEAKQYSTDVMLAILACLVLIKLDREELNIKKIILFSLFGASLIWFSHPIVFTLAALGSTCLLFSFKKLEKPYVQISKQLIIYSAWAASFATFYLTKNVDENTKEGLIKSWQAKKAFPKSWLDINWLTKSFIKFFHQPLGFPDVFLGLIIGTFIAGAIALYLKKKQIFCLLLAPLIFSLIAAYLYKYPFQGRLLLFLTPYFMLLIGEGANFIKNKLTGYGEKMAIIRVIFLIILIVPSVGTAGYLTIFPYVKQDIKPVINYVKTHQQPGDTLYVYQRGQNLFKYYAKKYGYDEQDYIMGVDDLDNLDGQGLSNAEIKRYQDDLNQLLGKTRVWVLLAHVDHVKSERKMIKSYLDNHGKKIDSFSSKDAYVYLYDFGK